MFKLLLEWLIVSRLRTIIRSTINATLYRRGIVENMGGYKFLSLLYARRIFALTSHMFSESSSCSAKAQYLPRWSLLEWNTTTLINVTGVSSRFSRCRSTLSISPPSLPLRDSTIFVYHSRRLPCVAVNQKDLTIRVHLVRNKYDST